MEEAAAESMMEVGRRRGCVRAPAGTAGAALLLRGRAAPCSAHALAHAHPLALPTCAQDWAAEKLAALEAEEAAGADFTPAYALNFLWLDKNIAVAVDQIFSRVRSQPASAQSASQSAHAMPRPCPPPR